MPHTLLLADDSVTIQRVIELTFADEDVQVVAVSDGDQAIERLESSPPDIVLADIGMPGRNGYEVARYVKRSPKLAHIPVVLLTGAFEPVDQARASEAGCDGVLAKPFEPQLVIGRVKDLLARRRQPVEAASPTAAPTPPEPAAEPWSPAAMAETTASAPPPTSAEPAPEPRASARVESLDNYFDRLDAAFTTFTEPPPAAPEAAPSPAPSEAPPTRSTASDEIDWFGAAQTATPTPAPDWELPAPPSITEPPADLPLSVSEQVAEPAAISEPGLSPATISAAPTEPDATVAGADTPEPAAAAPSDASPVPATAPVPALPSLADAFAALLAAEKENAPPAALGWPAPASSIAADEIVEHVTRRVLDQLSDRIVRETVIELVSSIAERLVREEIERIKSAIR